ncbi:hypothetical protein NBM05_10365 [Rothia sp. AR01]|uniref:Uncharacterized protein n=1 Tax=Rothia santali TaxID=2949643 RepID=A0A9X2HK56_9MICC|nr:hypothetical protein [Rothia santali]MCP3426393.1 hypothetical protein [Rothia santali]
MSTAQKTRTQPNPGADQPALHETDVSDPAPIQPTEAEVWADLQRQRAVRELADLGIRRDILLLSDLGVSQRRIALHVGLSQAEISRRLARRTLTETRPSPREIMLRRRAGMTSDRQMLHELIHFPYTVRLPEDLSAHDGAATILGTARQLMEAFHEGLLDEREYEEVRRALAQHAAP